MPNQSHTTHVDSRNRATTRTTSTEPWPTPDLRSMELEAAVRLAHMPRSGRTNPSARCRYHASGLFGSVDVEHRLPAPGSDNDHRSLRRCRVPLAMHGMRRHEDKIARLRVNHVLSPRSGLHAQHS